MSVLGVWGIYGNVEAVTDSSLFVWLSWLAKLKQKLSLNEIFNSKLSI